MTTLTFPQWITNAAARLLGTHGAVTDCAREAGCSRQSVYDHGRKVLAAVEAEHGGGPTREQLRRENAELRRENDQLWDWLFQTIEFPVAKQRQFAVTALAMGLSLNQIVALLAILLGIRAVPGRSTIHRWGQAAAKAAGGVLARLDAAARSLVLVGCLDEIFFHRRPVLVGVEPHSMVWFLGVKAADCRGATWFGHLRPWTALRHVVSDAGSGLQAGLAQLQEHRRENSPDAPSLETSLDVFHTKKEALRVLGTMWRRLERFWEAAEAADAAVARDKRQGRDARGAAQVARRAWTKASGAFRRYERAAAGWEQVEPALDLFTAEGQLNDRTQARQRVALALLELSGPEWSKVRGLLQAEGAFTFLDRLHGQLDELGIAAELRDALVRLWWLRRQRVRGLSPEAVGGVAHVAPVVQREVCRKLDPDWRAAYRRVSAVLGRAVRASSAVEGMNSVLRMHQSRHRTLTQGLLDLKRLYWNTRPFRGGKRKGRCPYEHLGLKGHSMDFWGLLEAEMRTTAAPTEASEKARAA
jgi:hypothetical protein